MKVNSLPRKENVTAKNNLCEHPSLVGNTGSDALPKVFFDWDWSSVNSEKAEDYYLDAVQFSILLSQKLSELNNFLLDSRISCPENYAYTALSKMVPSEFKIDSEEECFLPKTTRFYDGKPGLYYFLKDPSQAQQNREKILEFLDFEVMLVRDGYGTYFQEHFSKYYSTTFLKASPEFIDSFDGMHTYFRSPRDFYFTSEAVDFESNYDFILPDAGLYRIRPIIDFSSFPLISGGSRTASMKIDMFLKEPINSDYSPFYYTPFDGMVGLEKGGNRLFYGTSLNSGTSLKISSEEPSILRTDQQDSVSKINLFSYDNIYSLNSFPSNRGKLLDFSFSRNEADLLFSPTIATPILFTLDGKKDETILISYVPKRNEDSLRIRENNLFFLTALRGCSNPLGERLLNYINETPDFPLGIGYGFGFEELEDDFRTSVKTIAYTPTDDYYSLGFSKGQEVMTTASPKPDGELPLDGVRGMHYNDGHTGNYISSIKDLFNAVKQENVCVSRIGNREIYWWSDQILYDQRDISGNNLAQHIAEAERNCTK